MKTHYFDQETADLDDRLLVEAIEQKRVPPTCLWGGVMVQEVAAAGMDPCTRCPCPKRDLCGGRPMLETFEVGDLAKHAKSVHNNEAGARRIQRQGFIRELIRAGQKAKRES